MALVKLKDYKHKRKLVAHEYALNPKATVKELAGKFGVSNHFITALKADSDFWEIVERDFQNIIAADFLVMDQAMIEEAKEGNVQAYRAINEKYGKFVKRFQLEVKSPYELFKAQEKDAEITEYEEVKEIPPKNPKNNNPTLRAKEERDKIQKEIRKNKSRLKRKEQAHIRRRAKKVGLKPLPVGKPKPNKRKLWMKELEKLEAIQRQAKIDIIDKNNAVEATKTNV